MQWRLFATLAEVAGQRTVEVDPGANSTVGDALEELLERVPGLEEHVLDENESLRDHIRLLHEGRDPFVEANGLATSVKVGDELSLFPPVSGG